MQHTSSPLLLRLQERRKAPLGRGMPYSRHQDGSHHHQRLSNDDKGGTCNGDFDVLGGMITPPWTSPHSYDSFYVESQGDYGSDASAFDRLLFNGNDPSSATIDEDGHQFSLPPLPVPTLEETMQTFLPTALPFATCPQQVQDLQEACKRFPAQAAVLQERLLQRQRDTFANSSWLQQWWNQLQYLQYREPLFHVSYFYRLDDDPSCPSDNTAWSFRAAAVLQGAALCARSIATSGRLPSDEDAAAGGGSGIPRQRSGPPGNPPHHTHRRPAPLPLCDTQFRYVFHACRIPQPHQDAFRVYRVPSGVPHAAVLCRGQAYSLALADPEGRLFSQAYLRAALLEMERHSRKCGDSRMLPSLGYLTSAHRDEWADSYASLLRHDAFSRALDVFQSALCVLALDVDDEVESQANDDDSVGPDSVDSLAQQFWHGGHRFAGNRWMDKSFQLVVTKRGQVGYVGEHSMADGMPAMELCNYLVDRARVRDGDPSNVSPFAALPPPPVPIFQSAFEELDHATRQEILDQVEAARAYVEEKIDAHDCAVLTFPHYGTKAIKLAGVSPDAFCQTALQVAAYQVFEGRPVGTYEATQTRKFRHGRTETTRTVSPASQAFVQAFNASSFFNDANGDHCRSSNSSNADVESLRSLLLDATRTHSDYTRKALNGKGVDRHLWGLSLLLQPGDTTPDLFHNPLFLESKRWRLTTSQVPRVRTGFSMVEPDGIGVGYDARSHELVFSVVARRNTGLAPRFAAQLRDSLHAMQVFVVVETPKPAPTAASLVEAVGKSEAVPASIALPTRDRTSGLPPLLYYFRTETAVAIVAVLLLSQIILYIRPELATSAEA